MYWCYQTKLLFNSILSNRKKTKEKLDKLPKEWENRNTSNMSGMSTSDYTFSSLYNNNGNAPHNAAINHPSTSTFHTNYYSTNYYPPYNQQSPHTNINNNFVLNNNNIDVRDTSDLYNSPQSNQTNQQYQQPQQFCADTYNGGVGCEGYRMSSTATNWFKNSQSTEQQSNVMNMISMTSRWVDIVVQKQKKNNKKNCRFNFRCCVHIIWMFNAKWFCVIPVGQQVNNVEIFFYYYFKWSQTVFFSFASHLKQEIQISLCRKFHFFFSFILESFNFLWQAFFFTKICVLLKWFCLWIGLKKTWCR